jgi:hypothetical protein
MTAAVASLVVVTFTFRCLWLWQPPRQVLLHQAHLRDAVERRDWGKIESMLDPAYSDRWGYTRSTGVRDGRRWLGQFFALTINVEPVAFQCAGGAATVTERWKMDGTGTEMASLVEQRVNTLHSPFVFQWKHRSWKPWDWTLIRIDNSDLDLPAPEANPF